MITPEIIALINMICGIFTAIGTIGAVITALWLGYKDGRVKLSVHATIGIIFPERSEHLLISCKNVGKQPIICRGFAFMPNKFKPLRFFPHPTNLLVGLSSELPREIKYSDCVNQHFNLQFFKADKNIKNLLSKRRWVAKIQLKFFWKVVATTSVEEFTGRLSNDLVNKILLFIFEPNPSKNR